MRAESQHAPQLDIRNRLVTVIEHPRCMNCHTNTDFPRQGNARLRHNMGVARGPGNHGTPALQCATCHQDDNVPSDVPGNANWHLAPLSMAWEGLDRRGICRLLTDPSRSTMTPERRVEHMGHDPRCCGHGTPATTSTACRAKSHPFRRESSANWCGYGSRTVRNALVSEPPDHDTVRSIGLRGSSSQAPLYRFCLKRHGTSFSGWILLPHRYASRLRYTR